MKKKSHIFGRCFLAACALTLSWGMLYPEYTLLPDTCRVLALDEATGELRYLTEEELTVGELYFSILAADRDRIVFKSRLIQALKDGCLQKKKICD